MQQVGIEVCECNIIARKMCNVNWFQNIGGGPPAFVEAFILCCLGGAFHVSGVVIRPFLFFIRRSSRDISSDSATTMVTWASLETLLPSCKTHLSLIK